MEQIAPAGDVYQAGTLSGNPLAVAAALATLRAARRARLRAAGRAPPARWPPACARPPPRPGSRSVVQSLTGLLTVFFTERPVTNYWHATACDTETYGAWCRALLDRGVYPPASQFEAWFPVAGPRPRARGAHRAGGA